jgi:hypothetical protein
MRNVTMMNRVVMLAVVLAVKAPCVVAGEAWGPTWSEVTGELYSRAQMNRTPAIIKSIEGRHELDKVVKTEPGQKKIVVQSPPRKGFSGSDETIDLKLEPCKRYYINAQFKSGTGRDWEPVIAGVDAVGGCKVQ